ncbi:MAG: tryptophan synthase subunit alpha [Desulfobacterales bacterium C00003106]|jgi:tryptophan synthase alpha chain|nr:MAG: tryptophan synthase subunit alpha [Desulfobacterales bacterium C00003106]
MLESYLRTRLKEKEILLMTHIVLGYPTFEECFKIIEKMVASGVDLMELQIPFSEPIADGPVILHANQKSLSGGSTVRKCLDFAQEITQTFDIPFLFMTYYNILFKYGVDRFASEMAKKGLKGAIVPDIPPEEGNDYLRAMEKEGLAPVFIFAPTTTDERLKYLASFGRGFIYCVARKGVTGADTSFSEQLEEYLARCRAATDLPLALGFGVKEKADIDFLKGKADIAVIGSETIRIVDAHGSEAVGAFIRGLM